MAPVEEQPLLRQRDAARTKAQILEVATREFADHGYAGARVDEIAARTQTTKRMIYYYYGGKEQLYLAVLEQVYAQMRAAELTLDVEHLDPISAIRRLAELTFDHQEAHPDFARLVSIENIDRAEHMVMAPGFTNLNSTALEIIDKILKAGVREGVFRSNVDPLDVHMLISAQCNFRLGHRYTFRAIFGRDLMDQRRRKHYRRMVGDLIVAYLTDPQSSDPAASPGSQADDVAIGEERVARRSRK